VDNFGFGIFYQGKSGSPDAHLNSLRKTISRNVLCASVRFRKASKIFFTATTRPDLRDLGADVMILKIFSPKNQAKELTFLTQKG
jgi:hypothetical protein